MNDILLRHTQADPLAALEPVANAEDILTMQAAVRNVRFEASVRGYLVRVARATREHPAVDLGASPRGTLALYRACQAYAALAGRDYVLPDDIKKMTPYVLTHRIHISPQTRLRGRTAAEVVAEVVGEVETPVFG